jgi:hypothetical protein
VLKSTPGFQPTVTLGAVESYRFGWEKPNTISCGQLEIKNSYPEIRLPGGRRPAGSLPADADPVLRDFNKGVGSSQFNITGLKAGRYRLTVIKGNLIEYTYPFDIEINADGEYHLGTMYMPATSAAGAFTTQSFSFLNEPPDVNYPGVGRFSQINLTFKANWVVNSLILEYASLPSSSGAYSSTSLSDFSVKITPYTVESAAGD